jgi:hypothetical protein
MCCGLLICHYCAALIKKTSNKHTKCYRLCLTCWTRLFWNGLHRGAEPIPFYISTLWRRRKQCFSITKINLLMLFMKIINVFSENHMKSINKSCGQNVQRCNDGGNNERPVNLYQTTVQHLRRQSSSHSHAYMGDSPDNTSLPSAAVNLQIAHSQT